MDGWINRWMGRWKGEWGEERKDGWREGGRGEKMEGRKVVRDGGNHVN